MVLKSYSRSRKREVAVFTWPFIYISKYNTFYYYWLTFVQASKFKYRKCRLVTWSEELLICSGSSVTSIKYLEQVSKNGET